jgi:phosphoribosyl-dephospho-CoA transferase
MDCDRKPSWLNWWQMLRKADDLQVHDLLHIDPDSLLGITAPSWVNRALSSCPWVVVRRVRAPAGEIAVGVRGDTRSQRWGGFLSKDLIGKVVRPADLLLVEQSSTLRVTPAIKVLQQVIDRWRDLTLPWGPTGSVGFELATGSQVTSEASDLDIAIRAPTRITVERARALWQRVVGLQTRVDIRVETPQCGFSLQEYACTSSTRILLHYPDGERLSGDPWSEWSNTEIAS